MPDLDAIRERHARLNERAVVFAWATMVRDDVPALLDSLAAVRAIYDWLRESANGGHGEPLDLIVERLGEALEGRGE